MKILTKSIFVVPFRENIFKTSKQFHDHIGTVFAKIVITIIISTEIRSSEDQIIRWLPGIFCSNCSFLAIMS